jgi:hypothetical protein
MVKKRDELLSRQMDTMQRDVWLSSHSGGLVEKLGCYTKRWVAKLRKLWLSKGMNRKMGGQE